MDHEVDVEACRNGYGRVRPLGDEHTFRIVLVLPFAHLIPQQRHSLLVRVVLYQRRCHIHTKAIDALVEPERHDVAHLAAHSLRTGGIHILLPWMIRVRIGKPIVECGLALEKVLLIVFGTRGIGLYVAATGAGSRVGLFLALLYLMLFRVRDVVEPDEVVAVAAIRVFLCRSLEPGTLAACVAGHKVETYLDAALVGFVDKFYQIAVGPETRVHLVIVYHVVATVKPA